MRVQNFGNTVSRYELEDKINEDIKYLEDLGYDVHVISLTINDVPDISKVSYSIWFEVS